MRAFLLTIAAIAGAATSASAGDFQSGSAKATICHRTGPKAVGGVFRGHTITISRNAVAQHKRQHGDVEVRAATLRFFLSSKDCAINAAGNLFDGRGKLVQPVSGPPPVDPDGPAG